MNPNSGRHPTKTESGICAGGERCRVAPPRSGTTAGRRLFRSRSTNCLAMLVCPRNGNGTAPMGGVHRYNSLWISSRGLTRRSASRRSVLQTRSQSTLAMSVRMWARNQILRPPEGACAAGISGECRYEAVGHPPAASHSTIIDSNRHPSKVNAPLCQGSSTRAPCHSGLVTPAVSLEPLANYDLRRKFIWIGKQPGCKTVLYRRNQCRPTQTVLRLLRSIMSDEPHAH
jgi:hypothetical protein